MESEAVQKARLAQRAARVLAQIDTPKKKIKRWRRLPRRWNSRLTIC